MFCHKGRRILAGFLSLNYRFFIGENLSGHLLTAHQRIFVASIVPPLGSGATSFPRFPRCCLWRERRLDNSSKMASLLTNRKRLKLALFILIAFRRLRKRRNTRKRTTWVKSWILRQEDQGRSWPPC